MNAFSLSQQVTKLGFIKKVSLAALLCASTLTPAWAWRPVAERAGRPAQEFRGVWVASVYNLDWPSRSGLSAAAQRAELINIFNNAARMRLNAVILQIRPTSDALYSSSLEPWSAWLSGPGRSPGYDPLAFAVAEAHKRGLELHAWFNPFRATTGSKGVGRGHVSQTLRSHIKRAGSTTMLNPASSAARAHVMRVILDVVRRYNIDGVHLDDYFYPYPPHHNISDGQSPRQRRAHIDNFVHSLYKNIKKTKPWVRVGISPFGIWKPGVPRGVEAGVSAYDHLACDSAKWLRNGWVDYLAPQLYWRINGPQSYTRLMQWWSSLTSARPVWPGIASSRINSSEDPGRPASEIGRQIDYSRSLAKQSAGQLYWSWKSLAQNRGGVKRELASRYGSAALPPAMPWLNRTPPARPAQVVATPRGSNVTLAWTPGDRYARKWFVQARIGGYWYGICTLPGSQTRVTLTPAMIGAADRLAVRAVTAYGTSGEALVLAR